MPASSGENLNPTQIVLPDYTDIDVTTMEKGSIFISGGKLYFIDTVGDMELITST